MIEFVKADMFVNLFIYSEFITLYQLNFYHPEFSLNLLVIKY